MYKKYIKETIKLAKKGIGNTLTNPLVGCVIIKDNKIISRGYHKAFGLDHAEIDALRKIKFKARGATLVVNLMPCCHQGKTPACTDAIIKSGIKKVVFGTEDLNPMVYQKSKEILEKNNIEVIGPILEKDCIELNKAYFKKVLYNLPFVTLKTAMTLDGKIADSYCNAKWITESKIRDFTQELRFINDCILVGANTIIKDNPGLNVRYKQKNKKNWYVVILDRNLNILKKKYKVFDLNNVIVFTEKKVDKTKENIQLEIINKKTKIKDILKKLVKKYNINRVLVEGGQQINSQFLKEDLADCWVINLAPKFLGSGLNFIDEKYFEKIRLNKAKKFKLNILKKIDKEIYIEYLRDKDVYWNNKISGKNHKHC